MKETSKLLREWVIQKIKTEYAEDIDLLIAVKGHAVNGDDHGEEFDFFVPAGERGYELAETFIIDGIGHDLYPRSWERLERNAELEEGQVFCLGNSEILYARNEEVRMRYQGILESMQRNLTDRAFTYRKALEQLNVAMDIYKTMVFEEKPCKIRLGAGLIMNYLNDAVCYLNGTYMGQMNHLEKVKSLEHLPEYYVTYEEAIMRAESTEELKNLSQLLIRNSRKFIQACRPAENQEGGEMNYANLADWYQELSLCWRRIYYYCGEKLYREAFSDACYLQSELNVVSAEFGLQEMDLLGVYDYENLDRLKKRGEELERYIVDQIAQKGIQLNQYASVQAFWEAHS